MKPTDIKRVLEERGMRLTKSFGQNFLHDAHQLDRIVASAELSPTTRVLEIGPGLGPLTSRLLKAAREVKAVEKDRRLAAYLRETFAESPGFLLIEGDARLEVRAPGRDWSDWIMVSNLPYSVASPLLVDLALSPKGPPRMVVTVQYEVARRLTATAGSKDYGILSLLVQLHCVPKLLFQIPPTCFWPAPDVQSACVRMDRRLQPLLPLERVPVFVRLVKIGFSQRRKMMRKLLKAAWPEPAIDAAFETVGLSREIRAERVTLEHFITLTQLLANH